MPAPNSLSLHCSKCKISRTCPRFGSSPLVVPGTRGGLLCRIVGGYGLHPVDQSSLSEAGKARSAKDGPCLSIAEVPTLDEATGKAHFELVKVFHKTMEHPRARSTHIADAGVTRSHVQDPPRRTRS